MKLWQHNFTIATVVKLLTKGLCLESGLNSLPSRSSWCPQTTIWINQLLGWRVLCFTEILEIFKHFSVSIVQIASNITTKTWRIINILFSLSSSETKSLFWSKCFTSPVIHFGNSFFSSVLYSFSCPNVAQTLALFISVWNRILLWNFWNQWNMPGRSAFNLVSIYQ